MQSGIDMKKTLRLALENIITENTIIVCLNEQDGHPEIVEHKLSDYLKDFIPSTVLTEKHFDLDGILLGLLNDNNINKILFILPLDLGESVGTIELIDPAELPNFTSSRSVTLQVLLELLRQQKDCYILGIQAVVAENSGDNTESTLKIGSKVKELASVLREIITKKIEKEKQHQS